MKKILFALLVGFSIVLLAACGSDDSASSDEDTSTDDGESTEESTTEEGTLADIQEAGTVDVGFANEKPYAYEEDGELKGAAVDIATAVFNELGVENVEGHLSDFGQLVSGLNAGKFDVVTAGMAITPERCENVTFGEPEMKYGEGLIVKKGNPLDLTSYQDIADNPDVTVSIMQGATEIGFVKDIGVSDDQIQTAPDIPATFSAVDSDRADATTGTEMTIKMALLSADNDELEFVEEFEQPDVEGNPSYGAAAFRTDDTALVEAYNEKLAELKEDGTVAQLLEDNYFNGETNSVEPEVTAEKVCAGEY